MNIRKVGGPQKEPSEIKKAESPKARQVVSSKKELLNEHLKTYPFITIPLLRRLIKALFGNRIAKKNYINKINKNFVEEAEKKGLSREWTEQIAKKVLTPHLMQMQLVDLPNYERLIVGSPTVFQLLGNRFTPQEQETYLKEWIKLSNTLKNKDFKNLLSTFENFLNEAKKFQQERPKIYSVTEIALPVEALLSGENNILTYGAELPNLARSSTFLTQTIEQVLETTIITNPIIHENIRSFLYPPSFDNRTISSLKTRFNYDFCLSREFHPDFTLPADSDEEIDFHAFTNLALTNEKTMETRTMHLELPISGKMTKTEARKRLYVLEKVLEGKGKFDEAFAQSGLPETEKESLRKTFFEWEEKAVQEFGEMNADFNPTDSRPVFAFAREKSEGKDSIEIATMRNIFRLQDGSLSLLPPEKADPIIGQISKDELRKALKEPISVSLPVQEAEKITQKDGKLSVSYKEDKIEEKPVIWIETTITRGEDAVTRKTLYILNEQQSATEKLEEITSSGLLERDLLLAKAEFIDAYV